MRLEDFILEGATWEQLRKPFIAVLNNLDSELKEIRKDLVGIKSRLDALEYRGKLVDGMWSRVLDTGFKIAVSVLSVYLIVKLGLDSA